MKNEQMWVTLNDGDSWSLNHKFKSPSYMRFYVRALFQKLMGINS